MIGARGPAICAKPRPFQEAALLTHLRQGRRQRPAEPRAGLTARCGAVLATCWGRDSRRNSHHHAGKSCHTARIRSSPFGSVCFSFPLPFPHNDPGHGTVLQPASAPLRGAEHLRDGLGAACRLLPEGAPLWRRWRRRAAAAAKRCRQRRAGRPAASSGAQAEGRGQTSAGGERGRKGGKENQQKYRQGP